MTCEKLGIPILLFEGGMSVDNDSAITKHGLTGLKRVLKHLGMLKAEFEPTKAIKPSVFIHNTKWIRAKYSGLLHVKIEIGQRVSKGEEMAHITDPYGSFKHVLKARESGYVINANLSPMVYQGDAIFHISTKIDDES